jgi:hypothetical protein
MSAHNFHLIQTNTTNNTNFESNSIGMFIV